MSEEDIERLVSERHLARVEFQDREVVAWWNKALAAYADAQAGGISLDTAVQIAYRSGLQATLALLAAKQLRVKGASNHYMAFYAMQKLVGDSPLRGVAIALDGLRTTRAELIYEPIEDEADLKGTLGEALDTLRGGLPLIRAFISSARPSLSGQLAEPTKRK